MFIELLIGLVGVYDLGYRFGLQVYRICTVHSISRFREMLARLGKLILQLLLINMSQTRCCL